MSYSIFIGSPASRRSSSSSVVASEPIEGVWRTCERQVIADFPEKDRIGGDFWFRWGEPDLLSVLLHPPRAFDLFATRRKAALMSPTPVFRGSGQSARVQRDGMRTIILSFRPFVLISSIFLPKKASHMPGLVTDTGRPSGASCTRGAIS